MPRPAAGRGGPRVVIRALGGAQRMASLGVALKPSQFNGAVPRRAPWCEPACARVEAEAVGTALSERRQR